MMYAIVETGGKQYRMSPGQTFVVEKLEGQAGEEVVFDRVLALVDNGETEVGRPFLTSVQVKARILDHGKGKKIIVFKYKPKKNYRRKKGHRQPFTRVRVEEIARGNG